MHPNRKPLSQCSKMIESYSLILIQACSIISINLNNYPSKLKFLNKKMTLPIWMSQLLKIHQEHKIYKFNLLWKTKKIKILMFNGYLHLIIKIWPKIGLELFKILKTKKYKKWWIIKKRKSNNFQRKIKTKIQK
jgi:hypothetical protein